MARKRWIPSGLPDLLALCMNIKAKIGGYQTTLPLTQAQLDRIVLICNTFEAAFAYVDQMKASTSALVDWRNLIFEGSPTGDPAPPPPPVMTLTMPVGAFIGIVTELKDIRDMILELPGYIPSIGEDLMLIGDETIPIPPSSKVPDLKLELHGEYRIRFTGAMQGMRVIRVEYERIGTTTWVPIGLFTDLPGIAAVTPETPGQPEMGRIRACFISSNVQGAFSDETPVTVSP